MASAIMWRVGEFPRIAAKPAAGRPVLAACLVCLVLLLILPLLYTAFEPVPSTLIYPASLLVTVVFAFQIWSWRQLTGSLFDPYTVFLVAAMLFNGSRAMLEVFGLNPAGVFGANFSPETTLRTLYLVTLGLSSAHLAAVSTLRKTVAKSGPPPTDPRNLKKLRLVGWLLISVAVVPSTFLLQQAVLLVSSQGYFALFQREAATSVYATPQVLASFLVPGALLVAAASRRHRFQLGATIVLIGMYAFAQLFLGSRAVAMLAIVPYVWLWHRCIKRLPMAPLVAGGGVLVFIVLPLVGVGRGFTGEDRLSPTVLLHALESLDNPAVASISEMGGSGATIAYTTDLVPGSRPYDYGASYAWGSLTLIPNFFWSVHPAIAHGTPNTWLVQTVDPYVAAQGGGLGYSFLAEAYLNAGWAGVVLVSALLGFVFAKLAVSASQTRDVATLVFAATFMAFSLKYVRSDFSEVARGVVWYALGPYLLVRSVGLRKRRPTRLIPSVASRWTGGKPVKV